MASITNTFVTTATGSNVLTVPQEAEVFTSWARVTGTGALTATVIVEVTNDQKATSGWVTARTITLSGNDDVYDAGSDIMAPSFVRHRVTALTGTGANLQVITRTR